MFTTANLKRYKVDQSGTTLEIFIPNVNLQEPIESKNMKQCGIWLEDGRHITAEQRKKAYATLSDIAFWCGYIPEELKEIMKYIHISKTGIEYFSLSDCSIDTAREFINTILDFALYNGVPLSESGLLRTDDTGKYLYYCIKHKKCCICGQAGEVHHEDTIGMGNNRKKLDDSKHKKICLCRKHHSEAHTVGIIEFNEKYHVYGIVYELED